MNYDTLQVFHFSEVLKKSLKKKGAKGLVFGNFGACNTGDEAILSGQLRELKKLQRITLTVMSRYPERVSELHNVPALSITKLFPTLQALLTTDFVIVGGGGLYCKIDTGIKGLLFQLYTTILFLYFPLLFRKNLYILGIGFYKNTSPLITKFATFAFRFAGLISVRDHASITFLASHNVPANLFKDNSYLMPLEDTVPNMKWKNSQNKKYIVGFTLNKPQKVSDAEIVIEEIAAFIKKHAGITHFVFYSLDYHPLYDNDTKFARLIIERVSNENEVSYEYYSTSRTPQETFSSFGSMDFMVTSRLHGSIFSHRLHIPFYAISYDIKCESFLSAIGHQYTHPGSVKELDLTRYFASAQKLTDSKMHNFVAANERMHL